MTNYRLSEPASAGFETVRARLQELSGAEKLPSASVTVEFMIWWLNSTGDAELNLRDFKPSTRPGRPRTVEGDGGLRPSHIRKLAGVDSVTAERKLR